MHVSDLMYHIIDGFKRLLSLRILMCVTIFGPVNMCGKRCAFFIDNPMVYMVCIH